MIIGKWLSISTATSPTIVLCPIVLCPITTAIVFHAIVTAVGTDCGDVSGRGTLREGAGAAVAGHMRGTGAGQCGGRGPRRKTRGSDSD